MRDDEKERRRLQEYIFGLEEIQEQVQDLAAKHQELQDSRNLLYAILGGTVHGVVLVRARKVVWCNRALSDILGWDPDELVGKSTEMLFPSKAEFERMGGLGYPNFPQEGFISYEYDYVHKRGHTVPCLVTGRLLDEDDLSKGVVFSVTDFSARKQAEHALLESEEKYRLVVENANESIFVILDGMIQFANAKAKETLGYTDAEFGSKPFLEFIHPDDRVSVAARYQKRQNGEPVPQAYSLRAVDKRGNTWWGYMNVVAIDWKGRPASLVFCTDITDLKRAQSDNIAKSEFLANMSHELRTPLNAIIGFSEILQEQTFGKINETQSKYVTHVLNSGRHLLQLINEILDLSKVESGRMRLRPGPLTLRQVLATSMMMITEKAKKHRIALHLRIGESLRDKVILADEVKLRQMMFNLVSNAAKFTPDGGSIEVTASRDDDDVLIRVSDSGIGLRPEDKERIFTAFEQVESVYTRHQQGTGLGLTLTRNLVELHGGRIWAESDGPGKGSTFAFTLPYREAGSMARDSGDSSYRSEAAGSSAGNDSDDSLDDSWVNFQFGLTRDELTGLWNRSAIIDMLKRELSRCERQDSCFGIISIGIDNLDQINDQYGFVTGDAVLGKIAKMIVSNIRPYDIAGRYKGEDLIVISPGSSLAEVEKMTERLRSEILEGTLEIHDTVFRPSVSMGVGAVSAKDCLDIDAVLQSAINALAQAKKHGGNRIEPWEWTKAES